MLFAAGCSLACLGLSCFLTGLAQIFRAEMPGTKLALASSWVQLTLEAYVLKDVKALACQLQRAEHLQVDKSDLALSGAFFVLQADDIWQALPSALERRQHVAKRWKRQPNEPDCCLKARHPLAGLKPIQFEDKVSLVASEFPNIKWSRTGGVFG